MNRRSFMTLASGLLVPWEPERVYSFLPAWRLVSRWFFEDGMHYRRGLALKVIPDRPDLVDGWFRIFGPVSYVNTGELVVQPSVREIRDLYASGTRIVDLAARFGVAPSTVSFVISGQTWRHVSQEVSP